MTAKNQREEGIKYTFKDIPPVIYFFQPGSASYSFYHLSILPQAGEQAFNM
jgi:hypothetical protein